MISDRDLWNEAMRYVLRSAQQPSGDASVRDMQTGALLLIAFELRRIANALTPVTAKVINPPPPERDT